MNDAPADVIGLAVLGRMVFEGVDVVPVWDRLMARTRTAPDAGAVMDLATLLFLTGQIENGLRVQAQALEMQKLFRRPAAGPSALKLLAIVTAGDLMANTPLDFLLEDADVELISLYVVPGEAVPAPPEHDVAFLAIGESEANRAALGAIEPLLANWPRPVLNRSAANIRALTRDGVAQALADAPEVQAPVAARLSRDELTAIANGHCSPCAFPLLVRPIGSHAGTGLAKLDEAAALPAYLAEQVEDRFYVTPFVDYAGADGLFRKQRIVLRRRPALRRPHGGLRALDGALSERRHGRERRKTRRGGRASWPISTHDFACRHAAAFAQLHKGLASTISASTAPRPATAGCCCSRPTWR